MLLFRTYTVYVCVVLVASLVAGEVVSALGAEPQDDLLEELVGPSDEVIASLKTQARIGSAGAGVEAIWQLGQHEKGVPALLEILVDAPEDVVPNIVIALGWQGPKAKAALKPLTNCLDKPSFYTQTAAVWALGRIGDKASIPKLEPFLEADHELFRFLAEEALARCQGQELSRDAPYFCPLQQATLLHVSDIDEKATEFLFREALQDLNVSWKAVTVKPFNPSWSGIGGMPATEVERFSRLLGSDIAFAIQAIWIHALRIPALVESSLIFAPLERSFKAEDAAKG